VAGCSRARARRFVRHGPILLRFCHDGSHMRTVRSHEGSGPVGREIKAIEEATQSGKHAGTDSETNYNVAHHHNQAPWSNAKHMRCLVPRGTPRDLLDWTHRNGLCN
jgi:hypothetical protein